MDLGSSFTRVRDGEWLLHTVVWTGAMPVHPFDPRVQTASSLGEGQSQQPAKGVRGRSGRSTVVSQTALRA